MRTKWWKNDAVVVPSIAAIAWLGVFLKIRGIAGFSIANIAVSCVFLVFSFVNLVRIERIHRRRPDSVRNDA